MTTSKKASNPADAGFSLISNQKLLALHSAMLACRGIAEDSGPHVNKRRLAGGAQSILGHEAAVVGAAIDLLPEDTIASGQWPDAALRAINSSAAIARTIPLAARAAFSKKGIRAITLLFANGPKASQTSWRKAMHRAAALNLPILFVSFHRPEGSGRPATSADLPLKTETHAFPNITVDGNDVVAVYRVASEAIAHGRKGHGPTRIECLLAHADDPIQNMEKYLAAKGLGSETLRESLRHRRP